MKIINSFIWILLIITACTCNCNKKNNSFEEKHTITKQGLNYKKIVNQRYNADFEFLPNKEKDFILCVNQKKADNLNPFPTLQFCIFSIADQDIIYEQILKNGKVEWIDDYKIKITNIPTQIKKDKNPENTRIINVKLLKAN